VRCIWDDNVIMGSATFFTNIPYHVINHANVRVQIFDNNKDYMPFEDILKKAKEKFDMRILSYYIMPMG